MIQRIQTVYLALAAILMFVCSCMQIGEFIPVGMGETVKMYNFCLTSADGYSWTTIGLGALLASGAITSVFTIFGYSNRKAQSRKCLIIVILMLLWIGLYTALAYILAADEYAFVYEYPAIIPLLCIILLLLARRGIIHDEKLIRSVDRIR